MIYRWIVGLCVGVLFGVGCATTSPQISGEPVQPSSSLPSPPNWWPSELKNTTGGVVERDGLVILAEGPSPTPYRREEDAEEGQRSKLYNRLIDKILMEHGDQVQIKKTGGAEIVVGDDRVEIDRVRFRTEVEQVVSARYEGKGLTYYYQVFPHPSGRGYAAYALMKMKVTVYQDLKTEALKRLGVESSGGPRSREGKR